MRNRRYCYIILTVVCFLCTKAQASWFIDEERYHISVHGQTSCTECHQNFDNPDHPDPGDVNKGITDFFDPKMCSECHDSIDDFVEAGSHGGREVTKPDDIKDCLDCHDPHYDAEKTIRGMMPYMESLPVRSQCGLCHDKQDKLPDLDAENEACMACHRMKDKDQTEALAFCLYCHDGEKKAALSVTVHEKGPHRNLSCLACHPDSAHFDHSNQTTANCLSCHAYHDEGVSHDAHVTVSCEACHLGGVTPVRDDQSGQILWQKNRIMLFAEDTHQMKVDDVKSCHRCHFSGNTLGAAKMALPAKSLICMPCHTSTFAIKDTITRVSLSIFLLGMALLLFNTLSGSMGGAGPDSRGKKLVKVIGGVVSTIFSRRIRIVLKSLIFDSLLQQRLLVQSFSRWMIHGLIFYPFVIRFSWGLVTLLLSLWVPDSEVTRIMIDKNHPATAILFDVTGLMVLLGVGLAIFLKNERPAAQFTDMPKQDWTASFLLGGIIFIGFILEAMRIVMTNNPELTSYAFVGYGISRLIEGMTGLTELYGYVWYVHAVLTGLFVAYLPFSRMVHMILSPVVMALSRIEKERK